MRIGLVSYECKNRDLPFNLKQIERAVKHCAGKADLLCFGEAFLQGFDAFSWDFETDRTIALDRSSEAVIRLQELSVQYGISLLSGYLEKERDRLYSSCIVICEGKIIHNYRRISPGWKEAALTDEHYCEGTEVTSFQLHGKEMNIALCGDVWEFPDRFRTGNLLLWPVYVDCTAGEWENGMLDEYALQAGLASEDVLMINSLGRKPVTCGGAFRFQNGRTKDRIPFGEEGILIVNV